MNHNTASAKSTMLRILGVIISPLVMTLAFMQCSGSHSYPADLAMADTLCRTNPDSAVSYIQSLSKKYAASHDDYNRNYYQLLRVKAANNAYKPLKDSTIFHVMDFYEHAGDKDKLCQAYYYVGKYYAENNDAPQAISYYQKSLDLTDENTPVSFLSCIYSQSANKYLVQDIYDKALDMYGKSYQCDSIANDSVGMIYNLRDIATVYIFQKRYKESVKMLNLALRLSESADDAILRKCILLSLSNCYYDMGDYKHSKQCLVEPLKGISDNENSDVYAVAAKLYYQENKPDSMLFFSNKLMHTNNYYAKRTLCLILGNYYLSNGDNANALKYNTLFKVFSDSVNKVTVIESVAKLNSAYSYKLKAEENESLKASEKEKKHMLAVVLLLAFVIVSVLVYMCVRNKIRNQQFKHVNKCLLEQQVQLNMENKKLQDDRAKTLSALEDEINKLKASSESRTIDYDKKIAQLQEKLRAYDENANSVLAGIYDIVRKRLDAHKNLSQDEWNKIDEMLNRAYPHFKDRLYSIENLKVIDYKVCMLAKLGLPNSDIAVLINRSAPATSIKRAKLYSKLSSNDGSAKDFDDFIKNL